MTKQEQPDLEEKTYTVCQFPTGIEHSSIEFLATSVGGANVYYPNYLNNDDMCSFSLALEGEHSREVIEGILKRNDFRHKVVRGKSNFPYRL